MAFCFANSSIGCASDTFLENSRLIPDYSPKTNVSQRVAADRADGSGWLRRAHKTPLPPFALRDPVSIVE